jgi:hypothetical protein
MLIVGTKGKSLQGVQGLLGGRTSFSKWALQYSPIPVVVVRSAAQRGKKKVKRDRDPARGEYIRMLKECGLDRHESDIIAKKNMFEAPNTPDVEAHAVISALGLPENFIPRMQPLTNPNGDLIPFEIALRPSAEQPSELTLVGDPKDTSPSILAVDSPDSDSATDTESEESGDEFETIDARTLLHNAASEEERKQRLQKMKEDEARAFAARAPKHVQGDGGAESQRKTSVESVESANGEKRSSEEDEADDLGEGRVRGMRRLSLASTTSTSSDYSLTTSEKRRESGDHDHELYGDDEISTVLEKIDSNFSTKSENGGVRLSKENSAEDGDGDEAISPKSDIVGTGSQKGDGEEVDAKSPRTLADDPIKNLGVVTDPTAVVEEGKKVDKKDESEK